MKSCILEQGFISTLMCHLKTTGSDDFMLDSCGCQVVEAATLGGWCQDPSSCSAESSGFPRKQLQPMAVPETTLNWLYSVLTSVSRSWLSHCLLANVQ
jgi:hypothetical protein